MAEIYIGTKFSSVQISKKNPEHLYLNKLKYWCAYFQNKNLAPPYPGGSSGNLSFKISEENDFIITASSTRLSDDMPENSFSKVTNCNINNFSLKFEGEKIPSSESLMHYAIYKARPDINAIFHGHSTEILENCNKFNIPETEKEEEYGTIQLINEVLKIINSQDFVIIKNHGFISLGKDMEEAGKNVIEILNKIEK
jgi:L-fuculose-phosphate aldolase